MIPWFALALFTSVIASSRPPPPLASGALSFLQDLSVTIIPRRADSPYRKRAYSDPLQPDWDDRFLLAFSSHGQDPITLSLRPSTTLVHPNGIKTVHTHTNELGERTTETKWIQREEIRAYEGWVVDSEKDVKQWIKEEQAGVVRSGDAASGSVRIVLHEPEDEDDELRLQGSFTHAGELYTIHSTPSYLRKKDPLDPEPPTLQKRSSFGSFIDYQPNMVIVRESDILSPEEHLSSLRKRGLPIPHWLDEDSGGEASAVSCGHDRLAFNTDPSHPIFETSYEQSMLDFEATTPLLYSVFGMPSRHPTPAKFGSPRKDVNLYPPNRQLVKRQGDISGGNNASGNFINSIGSTAGCPKSAQVLFLGVALDYTSADLARTQVLTDFNSASALYLSSFNVSLGIVELNVQSGACPTTASQVDSANPWNVGCEEGGGPGLDLNARLSTFSQWRGAKGGSDGAGLWHLLTNCSSGSEVGVAWLGQLCKVSASTSDGQSTSGTGVTAITRSEWQVVAHEIGEKFVLSFRWHKLLTRSARYQATHLAPL
ncbi:hypothetical protein P7C70_g3586, partial [Phenoliferia sp. Uapishka_3]